MKARRGRSASAAETIAAAIANATAHTPEPSRAALAEFLHRIAQSDPKAALTCADSAVGILHQLDQSEHATILDEALALTEIPETGPKTAAGFFLNCPDVLRSLGIEALHAWIERGRVIGRANPQAAVAYFKLESAASVAALQQLRRSVHMSDVGRMFSLYCTAVGGASVKVKSTAEAPPELVREGHHLPVTDGTTIYLPDQLNEHASHDDNFRHFKVLAAHQAGYIEFGTFDLDIDVLLDHAAFADLRHGRTSGGRGVASHYDLLWDLFDDKQLARDIFFAMEDGRVDFRLRTRYRGLAVDLDEIAFAAVADRPEPASLPLCEALVESLVRLSIRGCNEESLPEHVLPLYRRICGQFVRVLNREATVIDSAVATARLYRMLAGLPNVALDSPACLAATEREQQQGEAAHRGGAVPGAEPAVGEGGPYVPSQPVAFRGQTKPELVQLGMALEILEDAITDSQESGIPLTRELLEELLKRGAKIQIGQMSTRELDDPAGLFITDLGGVVQEKVERLTPEQRAKLAKLLQQAAVLKTDEARAERVFFYDEWDYLIGDYRPRWCRLHEVELEGESSEIVGQIRKEYSALIAAVRRRFQRIRPEMLRRVKRLRSGEEVALDDAIEAVIDRRAGLTPSERIYQKRERRGRDVATAFLLDLSASTDEWVVKASGERDAPHEPTLSASRASLYDIFARDVADASARGFRPAEGSKRVIDVEREALVIMAEALDGIGDEYAIYGFSGYGRDNVEFVPIKEFSESYSERVRCRIGELKPRKSTRMGPAIRHALDKLAATGSRLKVLILLSDGYPQDYDYGPDRTSRDYGLHDTAVALQEAKRRNIHTFCVTVDQAGNDYLREMCGGGNYLVVSRPNALPRVLPRVYSGLTV